MFALGWLEAACHYYHYHHYQCRRTTFNTSSILPLLHNKTSKQRHLTDTIVINYPSPHLSIRVLPSRSREIAAVSAHELTVLDCSCKTSSPLPYNFFFAQRKLIPTGAFERKFDHFQIAKQGHDTSSIPVIKNADEIEVCVYILKSEEESVDRCFYYEVVLSEPVEPGGSTASACTAQSTPSTQPNPEHFTNRRGYNGAEWYHGRHAG